MPRTCFWRDGKHDVTSWTLEHSFALSLNSQSWGLFFVILINWPFYLILNICTKVKRNEFHGNLMFVYFWVTLQPIYFLKGKEARNSGKKKRFLPQRALRVSKRRALIIPEKTSENKTENSNENLEVPIWGFLKVFSSFVMIGMAIRYNCFRPSYRRRMARNVQKQLNK